MIQPSPTPLFSRKAAAVLAVLSVLLFLVSGCSTPRVSSPPPTSPPAPSPQVGTPQPKPYKVLGKWYQPMADGRGYREEGIASWYGKEFHGRKTANGEIYNMYGVSAAHKTLPLGTWVRVRNLSNGATMDLRINDRGPFVKGRIIDLSLGAAKQLGVADPGTAPVELFALGEPASSQASGAPAAYRPMDYYSGNFTFQVGAFLEENNARRLLAELDTVYKNAHIVTFDTGSERYYRVRVGRCNTLEDAQRFEAMLIQHGYPDVFTVAE